MWYDVAMTEVWKAVFSYADYEVSNLGRVRRATDSICPMPNGGTKVRAPAGQQLKIGCFQRRGDSLPYLRVTLQVRGQRSGKSLSVHRLVAEAFIPNPDNKPCVNHINWDISDARAVNLEWCTHKENALHSWLAGRWATLPHPGVGASHHSAKLTDDDVREIRKMSAQGLSNAKVAKAFGIDRSIVSRIRCRLVWTHVT